MKKRKKTGKRGVMFILIIVLFLHYISDIFQMDIEWIRMVRDWYMVYIYDGVLSWCLPAICEKIWSWKYYPVLYSCTGLPLGMTLGIVFFYIIIKKMFGKKYAPIQYPLICRVIWKIQCFYRKQERNMCKERGKIPVCRVIYGDTERAEDISKINEWCLGTIDKELSQYAVVYDKGEHEMIVIDRKTQEPKGILKRGMSYRGNNFLQITYI